MVGKIGYRTIWKRLSNHEGTSNLHWYSPVKAQYSARQRRGEERQAHVHAIIDGRVIIGEFLIYMGHIVPFERAMEAPGAIHQVVLVDIAAIDEQQLQPL